MTVYLTPTGRTQVQPGDLTKRAVKRLKRPRPKALNPRRSSKKRRS